MVAIFCKNSAAVRAFWIRCWMDNDMSKYKWKDLIQLNSKSDGYLSPLSCLAHIDLNAFFAQVEQVRCGYSRDDPVVCVQWSSLIAVSYAARKFGINRMCSIEDAMQKCPNLIPIHTAVFKKGEDFWQYHDGCGSWVKDEAKKLSPEIYKVALEPYRRESRKVFKLLQEHCDLLEKASVDEVFLDLNRCVFQKLIFDNESSLPQGDEELDKMRQQFINGDYDLEDQLPPLPGSLKQYTEFVGDVYNPNNKELVEDWDDVLLAIASKRTDEIRTIIEQNLGYTTSCGVANTKTVCKLASNYKKPDAQTIVKPNCLYDFLDNKKYSLTTFWTMGGNLGQDLLKILKVNTDGKSQNSISLIRESWPLSPESLSDYFKANCDKDSYYYKESETLSKKIFQLVRGEYHQPIQPRPMVKSMMSNKNLRGKSGNSILDCISWLEIFASELMNRILELEQEYDCVIIPRTVSVSVRTRDYIPHSKSVSHKSSKISSEGILKTAVSLIQELDSRFGKKDYYPLRNLNLVISNFDVFDNNPQQSSIMNMFKKESVSDTGTSTPVSEGTICEICGLDLGMDDKLVVEHNDYHLAMKLNEENSMSIGEQRLFYRERGNNKVVKKSRQNSGILRFFKK